MIEAQDLAAERVSPLQWGMARIKRWQEASTWVTPAT
jgi:hypothetical protein